MARVTGIGGVFLRSGDPARLAKWYAEHLGIKLAHGNAAVMDWTDEVPAGTGTTAWSVFPQDTKYFGTEQTPPQAVMINYRVDDLDSLLETLASAGVWIDPHREAHEYGSFAWIRDCDGNRLELWQPAA
ncbi:MAG TPA: VOC family protein [Acidobacteriaceae bacterium]|nr:VOC family protein [Acidobacteriaceae bacterium]